MKFSECWLRELVNLVDINSNILENQITMSGLKVDSVEPVANLLTNIVIGRVIDCRKHPYIDGFFLTKIDTGGERLLNIICEAPNCRVDILVAVAMPNAVLSNDFNIKNNELCTELSEGTLCSFSKLGMNNDDNNDDEKEGIIELPADAPIGQDLRSYLHLHDNIININVTPNRADCLSLIGIARDIAALNRLPLKTPIIKKIIPTINDKLNICVEAVEACPRYLSRIIKDVNTCIETPLWMKEKLRRCGLRSVSAVIDINNYVLLELGQPMHAFDLAYIEGDITVRYARKDEMLILLNGKNINLSPNILIIADNSRALAIAGVLGGETSRISKSTHDVVLECAFFSPSVIRNSAQHYGFHTDSSYRYERGVDPKLQPLAMERATELLITICGGRPGPVVDFTTKRALPKKIDIALSRKNLDRLIGHVISNEDIHDILTRLGCLVHCTALGWQVTPPSWRFDINLEEDLIEEITRMYGYEAIPNLPIHTNLVMTRRSETLLPLNRVKTLLIDRGYQEVITYSFVNPKIQSFLHPKQTPLMVNNPISQDMSSMRLSLWTGLINVVIYNQNRQQHKLRFFESGLRFVPDNTADLGIRQDFMLSGIVAGQLFDDHWDYPRQLVDFYDVKGDVEAIIDLTRKLGNVRFIAQKYPSLHPGQSAAIYLNNELIGLIGAIHPKLETQLNLNYRTLVFELIWNKCSERNMYKIEDVSCFPANRRDIAIIVSDNISAADIITECKKVSTNQLVDVKLFDVYRGNGIKKGFKSLTISLILQDKTRTLKEKDIVANVSKCIAALKHRFQASLRD